MQMAKVSSALARYDDAGGLYVSVLTNPTMGGVAASFASLGTHHCVAEPKALVGFAGPRTIWATVPWNFPKVFKPASSSKTTDLSIESLTDATCERAVDHFFDYCRIAPK